MNYELTKSQRKFINWVKTEMTVLRDNNTSDDTIYVWYDRYDTSPFGGSDMGDWGFTIGEVIEVCSSKRNRIIASDNTDNKTSMQKLLNFILTRHHVWVRQFSVLDGAPHVIPFQHNFKAE